jgi:hypothetical protein
MRSSRSRYDGQKLTEKIDRCNSGLEPKLKNTSEADPAFITLALEVITGKAGLRGKVEELGGVHNDDVPT